MDTTTLVKWVWNLKPGFWRSRRFPEDLRIPSGTAGIYLHFSGGVLAQQKGISYQQNIICNNSNIHIWFSDQCQNEQEYIPDVIDGIEAQKDYVRIFLKAFCSARKAFLTNKTYFVLVTSPFLIHRSTSGAAGCHSWHNKQPRGSAGMSLKST